jgi:hypothetical protein
MGMRSDGEPEDPTTLPHDTPGANMRRAATAAFATTIFAVSVAAAPLAAAAPAQVPPLPPVDCTTLAALADPVCQLVTQVGGVLVPVEQAAAGLLAPVDSIAPVSPEAPADGGTAAPPSPGSSAHATSASRPTYADLGAAPASTLRPLSSSGASSPRVPDVPVGSTLELGPLSLPSFGLAGTPAVTGNQLATSSAVANEMVLPAARAAAQLPDDSKATAVVMAFSMLLLAGGLLIDQVRKARLPIQF